jgi:hypothetical protein
VAVANVIGEQSPLARRRGPDDEDRFSQFLYANDDLEIVEDETVAVAQHRAARQSRRELEPGVRLAAGADLQAIFPAKRRRVAPIHGRSRRQRLEPVDVVSDRN